MHPQDLQKVISLLVSLREQTQREGGNGIMAPGSEQGHEECLALLEREREREKVI